LEIGFNDSVYLGEFSNNLKHGFGIETMILGDSSRRTSCRVYLGDFEDNLQTGKCILYDPNNSLSYTGTILEGVK